ncbi:MAG: pyridoxal-dependent decarboxylase, exosortase A system-associated, partial [Burkholderiales bacterium]|nr:pyridoxal-dependent decarboxylase, exosortase A system-associated [Burkholderiales bacterium]
MTIESYNRHAPHPWFEVEDDCLMIGGKSVIELAVQAGQTPYYVYDRSAMTRKLRELRAALPREVHLHFAMKANPMPAVVRHMLDLVDGIDVASAGEMQVALDAGATPSIVSFAGPGKTSLELARAAAAGITINIESEREIRILAEIGAR